MKKFIVILAAIAAMVCSCDIAELGKSDEPTLDGYYFKCEESSEALLLSLLNANENHVFQAASDNEARELLRSIPEGVRYEAFSPDGSLIGSDVELPQGTSGSVTRGFFQDYKVLGTTYDLCTYWPNGSYGYYPYDFCGTGEPLTTVCTANNYWNLGDNQDCNFMTSRQYYATSDLNSDGGYKSYYTRIFFGGEKHDDSHLYWRETSSFANTDCIPRAVYDTPITGLRLVINPNGTKWTPEQDITDPETGIVWHLADIYFDGDEYYTADNRRLGADLNDGAAGDFLYLYFTRDSRTGRKIMITNPHLKKLSSKANGPANTIALGMMGSGLLTWTSHTWKVDADDIIATIGGMVDSEFSPYFLDKKRVDFIRLYDKNMKPYEDDWKYNVPANFNRNARGKDEIFISYSYITPEDTWCWNWF